MKKATIKARPNPIADIQRGYRAVLLAAENLTPDQAAAQPLSPAAVRLFAALEPDQQHCMVLMMQSIWTARHPRSRKFRVLDLLATPEQRKAHAEFNRRVEQDKRERVKLQAERAKRERVAVRAMKAVRALKVGA